jgi:putative transposase
MSDKFRDLYRIPTARAAWWDYRHAALYFVTICTHGMECCLGEIKNNEMHLSAIGKIAESCWHEIPLHMPFAKLHAMVVMPNHVHGIIEILPGVRVETLHATSPLMIPDVQVQTLHATSLHVSPTSFVHASPPKNNDMAAISPKIGSLASVIRSYKSAVSNQVHQFHPQFCWHERFHDEIIRDIPTYQRIEAYIDNNVSSWDDDKFFYNRS